GTVEDPHPLEFLGAQQRGQHRQVDGAFEFRAMVLEIDHFADAWLGGEQFPGAGRGQGEKRHGALRRFRRNRANERQMPDDIADALLDLDDGGGWHVYDFTVRLAFLNNSMRTDLFDFSLPAERIALRPVRPRDAARLLVARPDGLSDRHVRDLPELLAPGD